MWWSSAAMWPTARSPRNSWTKHSTCCGWPAATQASRGAQRPGRPVPRAWRADRSATAGPTAARAPPRRPSAGVHSTHEYRTATESRWGGTRMVVALAAGDCRVGGRTRPSGQSEVSREPGCGRWAAAPNHPTRTRQNHRLTNHERNQPRQPRSGTGPGASAGRPLPADAGRASATSEFVVVRRHDGHMLLTTVVAASEAVAATRSRKAKVAELAALLRQAGPGERAAVVAFLSGQLTQGRLGVGWRTLSALEAEPTAEPQLTVTEVDQALTAIAETPPGPGSTTARLTVLQQLFRRATEAEQRFLVQLILGELRQGALEGVMLDGIAAASGAPAESVRRASMLSGRLPETAAAALSGDPAALDSFRLELGRPVRPMLASPAGSLSEAMEVHDRSVVEYKLDGARIQVHKYDGRVRIWTRTLREITPHVGELAELVRALPCRSVVLDGETLALTDNGR